MQRQNRTRSFAFYETLDIPEKAALYEQLSSFDLERITQIAAIALNPPKSKDAESGLQPLPESATASILDSKTEDIEKSGMNQVSI